MFYKRIRSYELGVVGFADCELLNFELYYDLILIGYGNK